MQQTIDVSYWPLHWLREDRIRIRCKVCCIKIWVPSVELRSSIRSRSSPTEHRFQRTVNRLFVSNFVLAPIFKYNLWRSKALACYAYAGKDENPDLPAHVQCAWGQRPTKNRFAPGSRAFPDLFLWGHLRRTGLVVC